MQQIRKTLMICRKCRDHFQVWGSMLDERLGLLDKDPHVNPNWAKGGDRRSENAKKLALNTKKQAEQLASAENPSRGTPNSERSFFIGDDNDNEDDDIDIHIDRYDPEPNEAPEDARIGLEDPDDEEHRYRNDENEEDDNAEVDDHDSDGPNEHQDQPMEEPSTILINNNIDASFLRGKIIVLPVIDGDTEVPICTLCKQPSFEGEIVTNLLENRLRNFFHI